MERVASFPTEDVLPLVPKSSTKRVIRTFAGHKVSLSKRRYRLFATKGTCCVQCGLVGTYMALERHLGNQLSHVKKKYHFNVYARNEEGEEVMITADHIIPKAKGGSNRLFNLQPMCEDCNVQKADKLESSTCSTTPHNSGNSTDKSSNCTTSEDKQSTSSSLPTPTCP